MEPLNLTELFPHQHQCLFGHGKQEAWLKEKADKGSLPHALIFTGPAGIGKTTMAYRLARYILHTYAETDSSQSGGENLFGEPGNTGLAIPEDSKTCHRIASGAHSSFLSVTRQYDESKGRYKGDLLVDDIRKIPPFMHKTTTGGDWRVVIIEDAHTMNRNGQNAILKVLEEPPPNTVLVLVATHTGAFLPTIRSRCQTLAFAPMAWPECAETLGRINPDISTEECRRYATLYNGALGRCLSAVQKEELAIYDEMLDVMAAYLEKKDRVTVRNFSEKYGKNNAQEAYEFMAAMMPEFLEKIARRRIMKEKTDDLLGKEAAVNALFDRLAVSTKSLLALAEDVRNLFSEADIRYLDNRRVLEMVMLCFDSLSDEKKRTA